MHIINYPFSKENKAINQDFISIGDDLKFALLKYEQQLEQENEQQSNVLCLVMKIALPEIYIPPGLIPVGYSWVDLNKLDQENDIEVEAEIGTQ